MVHRSVLLMVLSAVTLTVVGCAEPAADPDAGGNGEPPDARRNPDFRDANDCGGGGSGTGSGTGSGSGCGGGVQPDATPCDAVTFTYTDVDATSVWVTGSFTAWATTPPGARALTDDGAGHWSLTTQIGAGEQLYKLIVDGDTWIADPSNPLTAPDGLGGLNSVVVTCEGVTPS